MKKETKNPAIKNLADLETGKEYNCESTKHNVFYKVRCLGNYGVGEKVYFTRLPSKETPESMGAKFKADRLPNVFVCWQFMLNTWYIITN